MYYNQMGSKNANALTELQHIKKSVHSYEKVEINQDLGKA